SSFASLSFIKIGTFRPFNFFITVYDHLRYPVAPFYNKIVFTEIYDNNAYLAPVVRVYRSGRIDKTYAVFKGKSASWPYLRLKALWQGYPYARRNQLYRTLFNGHFFL